MQAVTQNNKNVICFLLRSGATMDSGLETRRASGMRVGEPAIIEDWCRFIIRAQPHSQAGFREMWRREPMLNFLIALRRAGGTIDKFLWEPRADLCMLRLLCEQGRAVPILGQIGSSMARPRVVDHEERELLERLFAWAPAHATDRRRRTRSAQAAVRASHITPLPRGVFKLVLSFWQSKRDWWWHLRGYARYRGQEYGSWD